MRGGVEERRLRDNCTAQSLQLQASGIVHVIVLNPLGPRTGRPQYVMASAAVVGCQPVERRPGADAAARRLFIAQQLLLVWATHLLVYAVRGLRG